VGWLGSRRLVCITGVLGVDCGFSAALGGIEMGQETSKKAKNKPLANVLILSNRLRNVSPYFEVDI